MVRATNAGGEAQSIADVAVFEPKPETMVEMHKTLIYEDIQGKNIVQVIFIESCFFNVLLLSKIILFIIFFVKK
jgi:hypothetical protein